MEQKTRGICFRQVQPSLIIHEATIKTVWKTEYDKYKYILIDTPNNNLDNVDAYGMKHE